MRNKLGMGNYTKMQLPNKFPYLKYTSITAHIGDSVILCPRTGAGNFVFSSRP